MSISKKHGHRVFDTCAWGKIEIWNYIECGRQNAEHDGNDEVEAMESRLSDEYEKIGAFFRKHGFNF